MGKGGILGVSSGALHASVSLLVSTVSDAETGLGEELEERTCTDRPTRVTDLEIPERLSMPEEDSIAFIIIISSLSSRSCCCSWLAVNRSNRSCTPVERGSAAGEGLRG